MLKNKKVTKAGSLKLVNRSGNTDDSIIVMIKTTFTKISRAQPFVIFLDAARHNGQT
jgi:hypothetical protein